MPFIDSQGTTLEYNGVFYRCTNITMNIAGADAATDDDKDVSTLDLVSGACKEYQDAPLKDCGKGGQNGEISFDVQWNGNQYPPVNTNAALKIDQTDPQGNVTNIFTGCAEASNVQVTLQVDEIITGSCTFTVKDCPTEGDGT